MTVRDAVHEIKKLERNLDMIEQARRQGFDLDVTEEQIDATNHRIEDLYNLSIPGARACLEQAEYKRSLQNVVRKLIEVLFDDSDDEEGL